MGGDLFASWARPRGEPQWVAVHTAIFAART
jgi:hypothetical protein